MQQLDFSDDSEGEQDDDDFLKNADADDSSDDEDSDAPITAKNMERKSKALDKRAAREAELDAEELAAPAEEGAEGPSFLDLPTAEEREQEKEGGGVPVQELLRRIQDCAKVLGDFKKLATKGSSRSEYVDQLLDDMANYYGYNEFLTEKLFNLFPVAEVSCLRCQLEYACLLASLVRPSNSSKPTKYHGQ